MGRRKRNEDETIFNRPLPPAKNLEEREDQLISLAVDRAEEQLRNGTASSQVIVHYLRLGSTRNRLELEKLKKENELLKAKAHAIESSERIEELYSKAIAAMARYRGEDDKEIF